MLEDFDLWANFNLTEVAEDDLELARQQVVGKEKYAVAFTKNRKVVANVIGTNPSDAFAAAHRAMELFYRSRGWIRPWQNIAAAMNFVPLSLSPLAGVGVDQIILLERPPQYYKTLKVVKPGPVLDLKAEWLGPRVRSGFIRTFPLHAILWPKETETGDP